MIRRVLWLDDDLGYEIIHLLASEHSWEVTRVCTVDRVLEAVRLDEGESFDAIILDAIVPFGNFDAVVSAMAPSGLTVDHLENLQYPGILALTAYPKLSARSVVLSLVEEKEIRAEHPGANCVCFNKLDIASGLLEFEDHILGLLAKAPHRANGGVK